MYTKRIKRRSGELIEENLDDDTKLAHFQVVPIALDATCWEWSLASRIVRHCKFNYKTKTICYKAHHRL